MDGYSFFYRPSVVTYASVDCPVFQSRLAAILSERNSFHQNELSAVKHILSACNPTAILWAVAFVVVYAIYVQLGIEAMCQRPISEWFKALPFITNRDPTVQIDSSLKPFSRSAPVAHSVPAFVQDGMAHSMGGVFIRHLAAFATTYRTRSRSHSGLFTHRTKYDVISSYIRTLLFHAISYGISCS